LTAAVGAAFTVLGLRALLIRRSWVVTDGVVDERSTFKGIGEIRHRRHLDVARIEMRTGLWETGAGRTDDLVLWTRGSSSPLAPPVSPRFDADDRLGARSRPRRSMTESVGEDLRTFLDPASRSSPDHASRG